MPVVRIRLFARIREELGCEDLLLELPEGASIAILRGEFMRLYPSLARAIAISAFAVNHEYANEGLALQATDEIAIIPPVSGG